MASSGPAISVPKSRPRSVFPVVGDTINAIGASISLEGRRLSWIADDSEGFLPVQAYVIRDAGHLLLVDTGMAVHRKEISDGFFWLAEGHADRRFMLARREPESFGNFGWVAANCGLGLIYYSGEQNPLNLFESFDLASDEAHLKHVYKGATEVIRPGHKVPVGALRIEVLKCSLRVLNAAWLHDASTGTLFTSDSWSFVTMPSAYAPRVIRPTDEQISEARIMAYLDKKFDWIRGIDPAPVKADLNRIFSGRRIERLCPSYGCILEGRSAVERVFERTLDVIDRLSELPPRGAMEDFRIPAALARAS